MEWIFLLVGLFALIWLGISMLRFFDETLEDVNSALSNYLARKEREKKDRK